MNKEERQQIIAQHAEGLTEELNLRLLVEQAWDKEQCLLWVEKVTVTDIAYPREAQKGSLLGRLGQAIKSVWKHICQKLHLGRA